MKNCVNFNSPDVVKLAGELNVSPVVAAAKIGVWQSKNNIEDRFPTVDELQQSNKINYQKNQTISNEGIIASEKTIRDLAAKIADRIGMTVKFESDRSKEYKGKIENGVAYVNLAYATLDTPIHEILGHPIIRAIKNNITSTFEVGNYEGGESLGTFKSKEEAQKFINSHPNKDSLGVSFPNNIESQLYQNLLKELETGKGKEVLDRIKRDYVYKSAIDFNTTEIKNGEPTSTKEYSKVLEYVKKEGFFNEDPFSIGDFTKERTFSIEGETYKTTVYKDGSSSISKLPKYTLEEQQEEAIVELLGLMTAEKLDNVKDGKLISLLKRLLKEMKQFIRSLINQKEVEIDKLPDNMTLGDLSDLLAYSNSKLILPGYEVEYTTPDNEKFKTYQEASNHISDLAKSVEDVDLNTIKLKENKQISNISEIKENSFIRDENEFEKYIFRKGDYKYSYDSKKWEFFEGEGDWFLNSSNTMDGKRLMTPEYIKVPDDILVDIYNNPTGFINFIEDRDDENGSLNGRLETIKFQKNDIPDQFGQKAGLSFIEKNKEYEQSKEIIEEWKKVNNIQYNPEEIYSRGQEFSSVVGAYSEFDVNLMMQNLLSHIEDNEKAGGKFAISAYTKPIDKQIGHLEGGGGKIKFKLYPQSNDILWAANTDVYSGSVWDASEKVNKDKKSELLGVSYTKYPSLRSINTIQPNLADIVDKLNHHHNELGIVLTGSNFRLEYDEDIPYTTKKIIDGVNKILDQKYGKLVKPEITKTNVWSVFRVKEYKETFNTEKEAEEFIKKQNVPYLHSIKKEIKGIQPTQTKQNTSSPQQVADNMDLGKMEGKPEFKDLSISKEEYEKNIKSKTEEVNTSYWKNIEPFQEHATVESRQYRYFDTEGNPYFRDVVNNTYTKRVQLTDKQFTSQALINTKIAALKEVAKKQPRSLIRSEVKPINRFDTKSYEQFDELEDLPFQKVPSVDFNKINNLLDTNITKEVFSISELNSTNINKNVDNSQVNKQLLFNTNNQNSLLTAEVLTNIIEQIPENLTDEFKVLIDKARNVLDNTKAKVEVSTIEEMSKKYNDVDSTVAMLYDANTNKIVISEEALTKLTSQEVVQSFIHEVVHAIVVKAIKNPQTFEEKEALKFFEKAFEQYKRLAAEKSSKKESYGFTNIDEFIAEIYSNPEFQNELKEIQGFWNELKDVIRRLLNMIKSLVNDELIDATLLINKVNDLVEQTNNSDFNGYSAESGIRFDAMFIRNTVLSESEGYNLDTIEKQIQNVLNKAKDILNQNIAHYKAVTKSIKDPVKKQQWTKFVDSFDDTLSNLETLKDGEELTGILNYVNSLQKGVASLKSSFDKKEFTEEETIQVVHNYTKYLDSFTIHKDIQKLLSDIKVNNKFDSDTIDISEIENALDSVVSDYTKLKSEYSAFLKNAIKLKLSTLKYLPELETMWINKLKTEYKSSPKSISQTEWIANAMNTTYKEDIDADIEDYLNKLINNPSFDISIGTHFLSSAINTNSHLIQIFNQILTEVKEEINQTMKTKEFELKGLFDKLVKEKGSSSVSVLYKNLISKNPNGNYSLVNDIKNLSKIEKEVLTSLKDIQDYTDYSTYRKQSKKVKINGQVYYELPSITKSDLERVLEGDIKGTIKDKWTDLTTIKADDVEFRYKTDNDHNLIYNVPVRYRAKIEAKDQSLDLFTVYRLEYLNGVNFKVKTKAEKDLTTIIDIAKSKEYYREEGGIKNYVKSTFTKNNEIELTPGEKSNTLKMLNSLLETNIYDIGHKYAGKVGKVDNNKLLSFFNGATASIGLSLNRFGATANVINAKAQVFLEGISKGVINNNNIKKAELLYSKEIFNGNLFNDLGQPVEKSFINQMNRMFDTFGFNQNAMNDFVKQGILKSYVNTGSLQFMHKTGEHWVQSVLTAAVLDSVKVMNSDNRFIDNKGNEVSEDKAASLLDMLYIDSKDGILKISDKVVYTTKSLTSKINEGGKEKINLLVDRKIKDCFGNYNPTTQPEASRHVWGKLILPFRRFYMEMATKRFKAFGTSSKSKDEIEANPRYKHYNYALQAYDEGTYTSLVRFLRHGVIPMLKQMKFHILSQEWEKLSDLERANIKHSVSEITATLVILPLIGMLLGSMLGGNDDDDEMIYFWMYQTRRLTTELAQFRNPSENIKMTRSPIPSMRLIENGLDAVGKTLNFWSWDEEIKSGPNKGDLKIGRAWSKMIPVLNQIDKNSKDLYKYQTAMFGSY